MTDKTYDQALADVFGGVPTSAGRDTEWRWEPDGHGGWISAPKCHEPNCPDFGSFNFGEGTCPAEHTEERP